MIWTCDKCGLEVEDVYHICGQEDSDFGAVLEVTEDDAQERIAAALERIADALEKWLGKGA